MLMIHLLKNKSAYKNIMQFSYSSKAESNLMSKLILYGDDIAPPVRFVKMTAAILKIDMEFQKIDLFKNENRTNFYRKINPLQKVPTLVADNTTICDSHAISLYLCQIAKKQNLYPENKLLRAKINQLLFFNASSLFRIDSEILTTYFAKLWPVNDQKIEEWYSALDYLENHLKNNHWLTGNEMLLCDVCTVATVTSILPLLPLTKRHQNVEGWINRFESLPFYEINKKGIKILNKNIDAFRMVEC